MQTLHQSDTSLIVLYHKGEALVDRYLDTATPPWIKVKSISIATATDIIIVPLGPVLQFVPRQGTILCVGTKVGVWSNGTIMPSTCTSSSTTSDHNYVASNLGCLASSSYYFVTCADFSQFRCGYSGGISSGGFVAVQDVGAHGASVGSAGESADASILRDGTILGSILQAVPVPYRINSISTTRCVTQYRIARACLCGVIHPCSGD